MHYIKDLFEGKETEHAHEKFIRYSKGNFTGPLINIKISKSSIKLNSSFHLVDEILTLMADHHGNEEIEIKGTLSWNKDLAPDLAKIGIKYLKVVKARGIFNYTLLNTVKFKEFVDNLGDYYILINFKTDESKLSTKPKLPKPNKEITADFCKTIFPGSMAKRILGEFAFDVPKTAKDIKIRHEIVIEDIDLPQVSSFDEARRLAKRIGKLKRYISIDGGEEKLTEIKIKV